MIDTSFQSGDTIKYNKFLLHSLRVRENRRFGRLWALTVTDNMVQLSALQERVDDLRSSSRLPTECSTSNEMIVHTCDCN